MTRENVEFYKVYRDEYLATDEPRLIRSLKAEFLTISGQGPVPSPEFGRRMRELLRVAFAIRTLKREKDRDFTICKTETLWWGEHGGIEFFSEPADQWNWKILLRVPYFVKDKDRLAIILQKIESGLDPMPLNEVALETFKEGLCVQMLHTHRSSGWDESVSVMHIFAQQQGLVLHGPLHVIYPTGRLGTPGQNYPILRVPVKKGHGDS